MMTLSIRRAGPFAVAAFLVFGASLRAQSVSDAGKPRLHVLPALGLHVGTPQKASVALGVVLGEDWQENGHDHSRSVALFAEPGLSAGRVSLAYVRHGHGGFGSGFGVAATVLRTWNDPWTVKSNMSFVGLEALIWPVVFVGPRIGVFHSVSGSPTPNRWFVGVDFGFGL